jgi:copper/silver efflux system protein
MLSKVIDVCGRNRFIVFTGVLLLTLAGIWSLQHVPLDALPDISDVQVIVHTGWAGEPPDVIEDQVTYPIVTSLLAAPHVKAVRAQTMLGDSYVYVVFEDGTDLYWARSRVIEYLQQISGRLPENVHPSIGPDATGAGWVYEYASSIRAANTVMPSCVACRTGICAMRWRPCLEWLRSPASAAS